MYFASAILVLIYFLGNMLPSLTETIIWMDHSDSVLFSQKKKVCHLGSLHEKCEQKVL